MENEMFDILFQFLKAFAVGGGICLIAQIIINFTDLTAGKILVYFMLAGVVLTAVGVYQPLVDLREPEPPCLFRDLVICLQTGR